MKKRHVYSLLFGIPGFCVSVILSTFVLGSAAGIMWIYVFGDNPWPSWIDSTLAILYAVTFLTLWIASVAIGYATGKKLETSPGLNRKHVHLAIVMTIAPVLLVVLHQWSVGNIGPKSDGKICSDYCRERGYSASGMPSKDSGERSCSCFDSAGNEALKVPFDTFADKR